MQQHGAGGRGEIVGKVEEGSDVVVGAAEIGEVAVVVDNVEKRWCSKKYADTGVGKQKLERQRADALCCVCENTINTLAPVAMGRV